MRFCATFTLASNQEPWSNQEERTVFVDSPVNKTCVHSRHKSSSECKVLVNIKPLLSISFILEEPCRLCAKWYPKIIESQAELGKKISSSINYFLLISELMNKVS